MAQEIYSDNIRLSPKGAETSALVTEINPGFSVIGRTARTTLNLNYRMQNLYNAGGNGGLNTSNQLQYNSFNILARNKLFLTSRSSISQQNTNNSQIAVDNISGVGNRSTVSTFGISPYWTPTFGHYANGRVAVNYDTVNTGTSSSSDSLSDTNTLGESVQINSGSRFSRVSWGLSFNNTESFRSGGANNVAFQNASAILRPYINKHFNLFAQGGYSNNSFDTITDSNNNGFFYTFGGKWTPSQHYNIEAGYGNNSFVTVYISPIQRFTWLTTYRDNSIGLNSGKTWQTALHYRTRRSIWSLTHDNDTTTTQTLLSNLQIFSNQDEFGTPINNPQANPSAINLPTFNNEVIVRKRWSFSVSFRSGKTTLSSNAYNENRVFQVSGNHEKVRGINASWNWQFAPKTSVYLQPTWQETERDANTSMPDGSINPNGSKDQRYDIAVGLSQAITRKISGRLEVRHINQSSDLNTNDYQENRATATMFMRF
ncbi:MAG: TIGR03016 family PEP-CTERM system-associated outer membrane protein [Methylococcaceae bacterium]|nr:TIGR03016 family PEP-CTERM system-associated outer membrane protein [Methylococcaceae bacterium]